MYTPSFPVKTADEVKAILGPDFPNQIAKVINHIDSLCRAWIERCPFIVISSISASGAMDISPKGDPGGFVKVLDDKTLAIPDRIGNHRGDTFQNVLQNPSVGIMFVIPKRREVLRVSGHAQIAKDPDLLQSMAVNGKVPDLALIVRVSEAFFHCGKAMIRSGMWEPEKWAPIEGLPSYAQALKAHAKPAVDVQALEELVISNEVNRLY
jgi:PPOX class probable FMN-dependent enzyme